jgi:hypothetical protein
MKLYSTLALGVSLAAATDPECSAQCGSEIGFVSSQGPELLIKYDGKQLHVPQHCRSEVCSELTSDSAALKAQVAGTASSQLAVNAALRTLLADQAALIEELSARLSTVAAVQQQDTARHEEQLAAVKRDTASADAALHAAVGAVKLYAENTAYVAPTPAPTIPTTPKPVDMDQLPDDPKHSITAALALVKSRGLQAGGRGNLQSFAKATYPCKGLCCYNSGYYSGVCSFGTGGSSDDETKPLLSGSSPPGSYRLV